MTNKEILSAMPVGEIVPKRILAALKRKGLIYDYSPWGYMENCRIWYDDEYKGKKIRDYKMVYLFPNGNAPKEYDFEPGIPYEEIGKKFGGSWGKIEYLGNTFELKYLDGCFSPYLIKSGPTTEKCVHRSVCFFGAVS